MQNITPKELKNYIGQIHRLLPLYTKNEKQFIDFLQEKIYDYISENPFCTISNITQQFGEPKDVIQQYLLSLDDVYIRARLRVKFKTLVITAMCISLIIITCLLWGCKYHRNYILSSQADLVQEEFIIEEL